MAAAWRQLWRSAHPTSYSEQGQLQQAARGCAQIQLLIVLILRAGIWKQLQYFCDAVWAWTGNYYEKLVERKSSED